MGKGKVPGEGEDSGVVTPQKAGELAMIGAMTGTYEPQHEKREGWRATLAAVAVLLVAAVLVAYAAPASYESLSGLAARNAVDLPRFFPVGVDGGLIGFIVIDIGLTLWGRPVGWLRQVARLFGLATVAFNYWAGLPDVAGALMRVIAPALIVLLAEAVRTVLLRAQRESQRIPLSRWLLAPGATFRMWRRMKLWRVSDYGQAIDMEIERLRCIEQLRGKFPKGWREAVPGDLVWCLDEGVRMEEALAKVRELCAPPQAISPSLPVTPGRRQAAGGKTASRRRQAGVRREPFNTMTQALGILDANPDINGTEMNRALGLAEKSGRGRAILKLLREEREVRDTGPIPVVTERG